MRAAASGYPITARRLVAATLARCYVCKTDGPVHRLTEHMREDHALSGRALRAALAKSNTTEKASVSA
jgi:hypothetical protein